MDAKNTRSHPRKNSQTIADSRNWVLAIRSVVGTAVVVGRVAGWDVVVDKWAAGDIDVDQIHRAVDWGELHWK